MLAELANDVEAMPEWLMKASANDDLPLKAILRRSLFYPACGYDGRPVQYFAGAVHSFVYVDQSCPRDWVIENLNTFKGYKVLFVKDIDQSTLRIKSFEPHKNIIQTHDHYSDFRCPCFSYAFWAVFERLDGFGPEHGPQRFSMLYIGGEGVSVYWSLYWLGNVSPFAITLIRSDGFTGNWTSFQDDKRELAGLVMMAEGSNPPKYFFGSLQWRDSPAPWRWYRELVKKITTSEKFDGSSLWRYSPLPPDDDFEERKREGRTRAIVKCQIIEQDTESGVLRHLVDLASRKQQSVEQLLTLGINPLLAAFFKARLMGCTNLRCTTCGGMPLRQCLEPLSKTDILSDLGKLDYDEVVYYESEIRSVLMYVNARYLNQVEISLLSLNGVKAVLKRMIEHHALRFERARTTARLEKERYLEARQHRADLATARLPNAIRRKDRLAVLALLRTGANPDYVQLDGLTARLLAKQNGVEAWLSKSI